jgi:DNA polymerase-4
MPFGWGTSASVYEGPRAPGRVVMHVDMDCFYASVELRRRPDLIGQPMFVGGATRGVVLSATYEARQYGVASGMPTTTARRLCPQLVAIPPDFDTYTDVSKGIVAIFESVSAHVEVASIDEAFCDISGAIHGFGSAEAVGEYVRSLVADEQGIACSVGIGPSKFVAKLASKQAKPDGLCAVETDDVIAFLHPLPVKALWGVGESTAGKLHQLGLRTVADLAYVPKTTLQRAFGPHQGALLADLAWGRDTSRVVATTRERSIGSSETFGRDTDDPARVRIELLRMADRTASRVRAAGMVGRTVVLGLRLSDFTDLTRSVTLPSPTDVTGEIHAAVVRLFDGLALQRARIRKVGVRLQGLVEVDVAYQQFTLDTPDRGWREAEEAMDRAIRRYGPKAVQRATLTRHVPTIDQGGLQDA